MKIDSYKNDPLFLTERYRVTSKNLTPILESFNLKDPYYDNWAKEIHPILIEAALDAQKINALFKSIEQAATASGGNRTAVGKAKDAAGEISDKIKDAWFNKLGGALQQSGPVKSFDAKYEEIKNKIAAENPDLATSLAKYKQFADDNPKLQKFLMMIAASIAGALGLAVAGGAAAGIAATGLGVGAGVAIVNIADRLLKGEKASTAIGRGGTAGLVAGLTAAGVKAAGDLITAGMDALKGQSNEIIFQDNIFKVTPEDMERVKDAFSNYQAAAGDAVGNPAELMNAINSPESKAYFDLMKELAQKAATDPDYQQAAFDAAVGIASKNLSIDQMVVGAQEVLKAVTPVAAAAAGQAAGSAGEKKPMPTEALAYNLKPLSEAQCGYLFKQICLTNVRMINEGIIWEKNDPNQPKQSFLQKVTAKAGEIGKNITTKVTASKLMSAWKKAGSPQDSDEIAEFLKQQGVNPDVISSTYSSMRLPAPGTKQQIQSSVDLKTVKEMLAKLPVDRKIRMINYLKKELKVS